MQHGSAEPSASERTEADGEESKSHVGALLFSGRELGDVFVVLRRLGDFAEGENENGDHGSPVAGPQRKDQPGQSGHESAENHGAERRSALDGGSPGERETNDDSGVGVQAA